MDFLYDKDLWIYGGNTHQCDKRINDEKKILKKQNEANNETLWYWRQFSHEFSIFMVKWNQFVIIFPRWLKFFCVNEVWGLGTPHHKVLKKNQGGSDSI